MQNLNTQPIQKSDLGSYSFTDFENSESELERLQAQGTLFWEQEKELLETHRISEQARILDLACGPGFVTRKIKSIAPGSEVTGVDLNAELLRIAKEKNNDQIEYIHANCQSLPFGDNSFDFVYSRFLFQHLGDPRKALRECRRILRPGGKLLILDVDDRDVAVSPVSEEFNFFTRQSAQYQARNGGNRFVGRDLDFLLRATGYQDIHSSLHRLSSRGVGLDSFFWLTTHFKLEQFPAHLSRHFQERLPQIRDELRRNASTIFVGIHVVEATA